MAKPRTVATPGFLIFCYLTVVLIWGTTWYAMKVSIESFPPIFSAGLRFSAAFPFLLLATWLVPGWKLLPPRGSRWLVGVLTVSYIIIPYAAINYGEQRTSSGLAAIIFASVTVLLVVMSVFAGLAKVHTLQWVAIAAGLGLLTLLVTQAHQQLGVVDFRGPLAIFVAAVLHAASYTLIARFGRGVDVISLEVLPIGLGGVALLLLGGATEQVDLQNATARSWWAVAYLAIIASVFGFGLYFFLLQRMSPVLLSFVFVFFPVVALALSVVVEDLQLTLPMALTAGAILIAFAVAKFAGRPAVETALGTAPVSEELMATIAQYAVREFPDECCGFIIGDRVQPVQNMADVTSDHDGMPWQRTARTGYVLSGADVRTLSDSLDSDEPVRILYHSHPNGKAYFSEEDQRFALFEGNPIFPGVQHLVMGVGPAGVEEARLFDLDAGTVQEIHHWSRGSLRSAVVDYADALRETL